MYSDVTLVFANQCPIAWAMNSGPLSLRTHRGTPRIANSSASVSITSSLVILRATFKARHSRVCSSTIDSHFSVVPLDVRSNTKSHVHTWSLCSDRRTWQALALVPHPRRFLVLLGTFKPSRR